MVIEKNTLTFTKERDADSYLTAFLDKEVSESVIRVEIIGTKPYPNEEDPTFKIGIATKEMVPKIFAGWFNWFKSSCFIYGRSDNSRIYTGKTPHPFLSKSTPPKTWFVLELDTINHSLYFSVNGIVVGCVTGVPLKVYFGVCNDYKPVRYHVVSIKKLNVPTIYKNQDIPSYEWEA